MRRSLIFGLILILKCQIYCQTNDDFSDGNFDSNPVWIGDTDNFIVNDQNELQLNAPDEGQSSLFTEISLVDSIRWSAYVRLEFAPSGSNTLKIFLASDEAVPNPSNALYFEVGETGSGDALKLYEVVNGSPTLLAEATEGSLGSDPAEFSFTLEKDQDNDWILFVGYGDDAPFVEWAIPHNSQVLDQAQYFGFHCTYSTTRVDKFFFDDISIQALLPDMEAPELSNGMVNSSSALTLCFSEPMDISSLENTANYNLVPGNINPTSVVVDPTNSTKCALQFEENFVAGTDYTIEVSGTTDEIGNTVIPGEFSFRLTAPEALAAIVNNPNEIEVIFSEAMDMTSIIDPTNYSISPSLGMPDDVFFNSGNGTSCILIYDAGLESGTAYTLQVMSVENELLVPIVDTALELALSEAPEPGDVVINEILSNPASGGFDFIEIFNNSEKFIKLSSLYINNTERENAQEQILNPGVLLPFSYLAISPNVNWLTENYTIQDPNALIQNNMPAFNDDSGNVSIWTPGTTGGFTSIDSVDYNSDWHYILIRDEEAISLERLDFSSPSNDSLNWHSAASTAGFATPGYKNSQLVTLIETSEMVTINEKVFSPNEDGQTDQLIINYLMDKPGYTGSIKIFNDRGFLVRELYDQITLGGEGFLTWDGTKNDLQKASVGMYIIRYEFFHPDGDLVNGKEVVVLADFLNR